MTQIEYPLSLLYVSPGTLLQGAIFPPAGTAEAERIWVFAMETLARRLNPPRGLRSNPRVVKRKVLKWAAKRLHHHHWPQPEHPPQICVLVLN